MSEGEIKERRAKFWDKNLPRNFDVGESLEVIWEVIHEWKGDMQNHEVEEREEDVDNVNTAMSWVMDELGYTSISTGK